MRIKEILGIVGSSKATDLEHYKFVENLINEIYDNTIIVTGDADGIDLCVRLVCQKYNLSHTVIYSKTKDWDGFKKRNEVIAKYCDRVISIALPLTKTPCYHCNSNTHEKTAGCYTGKINGNYEVKILPTITTKGNVRNE